MRYKVTVLSPLLVGDGRRLSPIDYMIWKDQVNVLDQYKIFRLLAKGPRLEPYLTQLRRAEKLDFASWGGFAQNYAGRRIPFEHSSMTAVWNSATPDQLHIPTFCAGPSGAFPPASALKGALRTAFLFSRASESTLKEVAARAEGERGVRRPGALAETMMVGGSSTDPMRVISAGDSETVDNSSFKVFLNRVASIVPKGQSVEAGWKVVQRGTVQRPEQSTAIFTEMAVPGTVFSGGWSESGFLRASEIARSMHWKQSFGQGDIIAAANTFSRHLLGIQKRYAEALKLVRVASALHVVEGELDAAERDGGCVVNLGWGGGLLSKAPVTNTADEDYRRIVRLLPFYERAIRTGMPFPKTRKIVFFGGEPGTMPGWARLDIG